MIKDRDIYSTTVRTGRHAESPSLDDARYLRCNNCGFVNHLDRSFRAPEGSRTGDGITHELELIETWSSQTLKA